METIQSIFSFIDYLRLVKYSSVHYTDLTWDTEVQHTQLNESAVVKQLFN